MSKYSNELLAGMNKGQLREAMRAEGLSYNGLNNAGMIEALAKVPAETPATSEEVAAHDAAAAVVVQETDPVPVALQTADAPVEPAVEVVRAPRVLPTLPVVTPVFAKPAKERKIQANRPEAHGVKRPSEGTICAQIWAWCDEVHKAGDKVTAKELRAALPDLDDTTKTVQYYRWRKFNGIQGRS
jgi:hypothetical protein